MEQEQAEEALKNVKKVPHHMGHSRNPSAASAISFCSVISEPISEVNEKEYGKSLQTILNDLNFEVNLVTKIIWERLSFCFYLNNYSIFAEICGLKKIALNMSIKNEESIWCWGFLWDPGI